MQRKRNNPQIAHRMQVALQAKAQTYAELVALSGLNQSAVANWVKTLREMTPSPIHVEAWGPDRNGRLFVPLWRWGTKMDAPRPGPARTPQQRMEALRAARKEDR